MSIKHGLVVAACWLALSAAAPLARAEDDADELAKKLSNPVASLISVPLQSNFDFGAGLDDHGFAYVLNIQPVIPISIGDDWNMISRSILPVAFRNYLPPPDGDTFGLGDITQSLFFTPKAQGPSGIVLGVGPAFLIPT